MDQAKGMEGSPDPRRLACDILTRLERRSIRASQELARLGGRLADSRDIALATELVYGTLRHRSELDHHLEALSGRRLEQIAPGLLAPLRIGLYQILHLDRVPPSAAVNASVRIARETVPGRGAGFVNAVLRKASAGREGLRLPEDSATDLVSSLALRYSVPAWMVARWKERLGDGEVRELLAAFARPSPLTLWVNPLLGTPEQLLAELRQDGIRADLSPLLPGSLRVEKGNPANSRSFREGRFYFQDEASQAVALLLAPRPGETLIDLCAAPGGKSIALAAGVGPAGSVLAVDRDSPRLRILIQNRDRLRIGNLHPLAADLEEGCPLLGRYPGVFLDAPCSGTGILGRHPEIRWRRELADLSVFRMRQGRLLARAAELVAPGGRLVYSVCSLEPEEGEDRIGEFLSSHVGFQPEDASSRLPPALRHAIGTDGHFRTWPHRDGCDGFFAAVLRHRGEG